MKKVFYSLMLVLTLSLIGGCETFNEEIEPIVKTDGDDTTVGGQGGGQSDPDDPE
ncbi:MAG: hypothetical protein AAF620_01255 [Bacteroidota bacterium]